MRLFFDINTKNLNLTKFLNNGFLKTLQLDKKHIGPIRFDHAIQLDEGIYDLLTQDKFTTSSAVVREIHSLDGVFKYRIRENESENGGIRYECSPLYEENREGNRKSHFVYYASTSGQKVIGKRQTFEFALTSALNAVKEVLTSDFIVNEYGTVIENGPSLQIRTLKDIYNPTAKNLSNNHVYDRTGDVNYKVTLLCIASLYFLQKTFCLDSIEIESYDATFVDIIKFFNEKPSMLTNREWNIYLSFLYLISAGGALIKDSESSFGWKLISSTQKKFHHKVNFTPYSFQNVAVGDSYLNLTSNLARIKEDINVILGYDCALLSAENSIKDTSIDIKNIIKYYILPNIIDSSQAYKECVKSLYATLQTTSNISEIKALERIISPTATETSLVHNIACDIIRKLYHQLPIIYQNYINRCKNELLIPKLNVDSNIRNSRDFQGSFSEFGRGLAYIQNGETLVPQFHNFGYTLQPQNLCDTLACYGLDPQQIPSIQTLTNLSECYMLRINPACYKRKALMPGAITEQDRNRTGTTVGMAQYEIMCEVIDNLVSMGFSVPKGMYNMNINNERLQSILSTYIYNYQNNLDPRTICLVRRLIEDLKDYDILRISRIVSTDEVVVNITANLFVLNNLKFILDILLNLKISRIEARQLINDDYTSPYMSFFIKNLTEAGRQILGFFGEYMKDYEDIMPTTNTHLLNQLNPDGVATPDLWYNYNPVNLISIEDILEKREMIYHKDPNFLNIINDLLNYVGHSANTRCMANILDFNVTGHIERKMVFGKSGNNLSFDIFDLWEPHTMNISISVPYAEFLRLEESNDITTNKYTLVLPTYSTEVTRW